MADKIIKFRKGETFEGQELYSYLSDVIDAVDISTFNPDKNEWVVTKDFEVIFQAKVEK